LSSGTFFLVVHDEAATELHIEALGLLEELLLEFSGTLILVSHDRAFLDNVVTSTLVLEGKGAIGEDAGGYTDWLRQRKAPEVVAPVRGKRAAPQPVVPQRSDKKDKKRKLSFVETKELAALP